MLEQITMEAADAVREILEAAPLKAGSLFVVGCSSSEMVGGRIGKNSSCETAKAAFDGIYPVLCEHGIYLAAQCCEHLNRALILEKEAAEAFGYEPVMVVPQPKAGGSFATVTYRSLRQPVAVEHIRAQAGMDIGGTMIGMHLKDVAVPLRISKKQIGQAILLCAYTRPKYIGGPRAQYE
ncbi:TIGR01440 family protein [Yeguia hominis]|uniref:UPF0340 protein IAG03_12180 n=1 Tax=Yeguia hominis TaxID=2763662 RepID=A0A926DBF3_9FIRM|nr:TIGR01440 family protein [Yeguia hominis]MBC8534729.1 TIGR01440 family protein [Yeguia hominis]